MPQLTPYFYIALIALAVGAAAAMFDEKGRPLRERLVPAAIVIASGLFVYGLVLSVVDLIW